MCLLHAPLLCYGERGYAPVMFFLLVVLDEVLARHVLRLLQPHDVEDRRSHVGESSVLNGSRVVVCDVDERYRVQRVGCVRCAVLVDCVVGVAVVGYDDSLCLLYTSDAADE